MIGGQAFAAQAARALAAARDRLRVALAAAVPPDVAVTTTDDGIVLTGRALAERSLVDARLRDFAALVR